MRTPIEHRTEYAYPTHALSWSTRRALIASGVWLRLGFIGAFGFGAGVLQLFEGGMSPLSALALAVGGGALAVVSWWRGRAALENVDEATVVTSGAASLAAATGTASRSVFQLTSRG